MPDITSTHLEAALIDQNVAGAFHGEPYAFIAVYFGAVHGIHKWRLGVAVANERGYNPIDKFFDNETEARSWAEQLNRHIGIDDDTAIRIVVSTMAGQRYEAA